MSRRKKHRKSRKRLTYGIIAVAFILACSLAYFSLHSSPPKVAIVDHLGFLPGQSNPTFVNACTNILEEGGLSWTYYSGEKVTVNFYRKLPSYGTSLIILRVHSAIMKTEEGTVSILGLFTSELYSDHKAATTYREDVLHDPPRLVKAFFEPGGTEYFGIVPEFIDSMKGEFKNTIIIMMGCEGLGYIDTRTGTRVAYTDMAAAFVEKGAKVYISWDGPVGLNHTDRATEILLERLILDERKIEEAVNQTNAYVGPDHTFNSTLKYHPNTPEAGGYIIPNLRSSLTMSVAYTPTTPKAPKISKFATHR